MLPWNLRPLTPRDDPIQPSEAPRSPRPLGEVSSKGRGLPKGCGKRLTVDHLLAEMGLRALVVGALLVDYRLVGSEGFEVT